MNLRYEEIRKEVFRLGKDILQSDRFAKAAQVPHHLRSNIAAHSIRTAQYALALAKWLNHHHITVSEADVVRTALLHDIGMTEDRVFRSPPPLKAYTHPWRGSHIGRDEFRLKQRHVHAIRRHMWPICILPPANRIGWIVLAADKYCSHLELKRDLRKILKRK